MATPKKVKNAAELFLWDYDSTLFPLSTNRLVVERYAKELRAFIQDEILGKGGSFQLQHRVFASKRSWFLRRTVKLDPVSEYFLYDIIYRNRTLFKKPAAEKRKVLGFRIATGAPISALRSYVSFKSAVAANRDTYTAYAYFDIASYFNHVYHHDLVRWFEDIGAEQDDVAAFGKFLREIVGGRSIDCLPHGLYPAKMVGAAFLGFLESSNRVRAAQTVRLMDDMWLFDNDPHVLVSDFLAIQSLLSDRGLSINDKKSAILEGKDAESEIPTDIDAMKIRLLRRRREVFGDDYADDPTASEEQDNPEEFDELTDEEQSYLLTLLRHGPIEEEDAELVLTLMREHSQDVMEFLPFLVRDFPALAKRIYHFCNDVEDTNAVCNTLCEVLEGKFEVTEYQLFWFGKMAEDQLLKTSRAGDLLRLLYEHENATAITKAKVLEIPSKRFGLPDLREEQLRTGHSDWLAWSAAVGARVHAKGQRNQILKYFRKSSQMNQFLGEFVETVF
jgi:hypothetical protein